MKDIGRQRPDFDVRIAGTVAHLLAQQAVFTQAAGLIAQTAAISWLNRHPLRHAGMHRHRHTAQQAGQQGLQAQSRARPQTQIAGKRQQGARIILAPGRIAQADQAEKLPQPLTVLPLGHGQPDPVLFPGLIQQGV